MPPAPGASGKGPDGVEVTWPGLGTVRLEMAQVQRVGDFLVGTVQATALDGEGSVGTSMQLPRPLSQRWAGRGGTDGGGSDALTLLAGGMRYLPVDYQEVSGVRRPLTSQNLPTLKQGVAMSMPVVWPDTGQDTIVVDLPGTQEAQERGPVARLTDIPVVGG